MGRVEQTKITKEDISIPSQVLNDITNALLDYFNTTLQITVKENNQVIKVKTWSVGQERKALKTTNKMIDKNKRPIYPRMVIQRGSIIFPEEKFVYNTGGTNSVTISKLISNENKWKSHDANQQPVYQIIKTAIPVKTEISYTLTLKAKYISSMNSMIEAIAIQHSKIDIVTPDGFTLRIELPDFSDESNLDDYSDSSRDIKMSVEILVKTLLAPPLKEGNSVVTKTRTANRISFSEEFIT